MRVPTECETDTSSQRVKQLELSQKYACQDVEVPKEARFKCKRQHRLDESENDREKRLARMREYGRQRCQNESEEKRAERLAKMRAREHQRRLEESEDDRAKRLTKMRAYQHQRRQSKQTRQLTRMVECEHELKQDVSHAINSVQLPIPKMNDKEDQPSKSENNDTLPCEIQNGEDVSHYDNSQKEDQLDKAQNERAKRLARMRAYEKQRRQQETEEDRAIRLAKMRTRERQRRLEETEEERTKRLARMRARRQVNQAKQLERTIKYDQEQEQNVLHANSTVQVLGGMEDQQEESEGNTSKQLAVNEHQHQQEERTEQFEELLVSQSQDDSIGQVPIPRVIKQDNQDVFEGDTAEKVLTYEHLCGHNMLHADSSGQLKDEAQQGELEGDCRAICYYSYCDL